MLNVFGEMGRDAASLMLLSSFQTCNRLCLYCKYKEWHRESIVKKKFMFEEKHKGYGSC